MLVGNMEPRQVMNLTKMILHLFIFRKLFAWPIMPTLNFLLFLSQHVLECSAHTCYFFNTNLVIKVFT